ncbi:MAG: hypothetical protein AAB947_01735 [Patescibacteria group bacterium]
MKTPRIVSQVFWSLAGLYVAGALLLIVSVVIDMFFYEVRPAEPFLIESAEVTRVVVREDVTGNHIMQLTLREKYAEGREMDRTYTMWGWCHDSENCYNLVSGYGAQFAANDFRVGQTYIGECQREEHIGVINLFGLGTNVVLLNPCELRLRQ